jgi:hypothetical protein
MNEGAELATAGLVGTFAAVLLVASHCFIELKSAKQFVTYQTDLKTATKRIATSL